MKKTYRPRGLEGESMLDWIYSQCKRKRRPWGYHYWKQKMEDECILWQGARRRKGGYGCTGYKNKVWDVHRLVWFLTNKMPIPKGKQLNHKCDNPLCINLNHIYVDTQARNIRDMEERGRARKVKGEDHGNAVLSNLQVRRIRRMHARKERTRRELQEMFGVSKATIARIVRGKTYKEVS